MEDRKKKIKDNRMDFKGMDSLYFLIGLLSEFVNRLQTRGDTFFEEISWKQCFLMICINLFEEPPTLKELSEAAGSSHQNVKQMLLKLEKAGFVEMTADPEDKRKQRVVCTEKMREFDEKYEKPSDAFIKKIYQNVDPGEVEITIRTILRMDENLKEEASCG